jgi:hypothetical protein
MTSTGIRQLELEASVAGESVDGPQQEKLSGRDDQSASRMFVASNRELVLEQLAAMVLSPYFPSAQIPADTVTRPPFLVSDGLTRAEIDVLAAGLPQRFPVLVEVRPEVARTDSGAIGVRDVLGLRFMNQGDADDFRCLPFDELDTAFFPCEAEPALFALDGAVRPGIADPTSRPDARLRGGVADRVAGALCCLLELGAAEPACWAAIAGILARVSVASHASGIDLGSVLSPPDKSADGIGSAVARAFMTHEGGAPGTLIDEVAQRVTLSATDSTLAPTVSRWLDIARAVLGNRAVLSGEMLSDGGSIPLRAAILAVVVDDVGQLVPFLHAERPAGHTVIATAAALLGLRTGLRNLSWRTKAPHLDLLSELLVALHEEDIGDRVKAVYTFEMEPEETAGGAEFVLWWRNQELARWTNCSGNPDDATHAPSPLPEQVREAGVSSTDVPAVESSDSLPSFIETRDGRRIEVIRSTDAPRILTLRAVLPEADKLRKAKEIFEAACQGGVWWRVGMGADGSRALYLDVPCTNDAQALHDAARTLAGALAVYVVPPKAARKKSAASTSLRKKGVNVG